MTTREQLWANVYAHHVANGVIWFKAEEEANLAAKSYDRNASPTHERAAPAPEPVYWESRWLDTANMPHTWSEWQRCEPRNPYTDTAADKAREIQGYIDAGYKYELRALYASPSQPAEGVREPMTWPEIDEAARRAQISFCLDKKPSFEIALVREVEAHHGIASGSAESKDGAA